ncbi:peptide deformylase [Candidatus Poriferisocius sp.]|uniref:peptide deformylase n=1 Tax=Candidatus Poriferisocius sp. TaxID=3101276 RepID=UPI003B0270B9
MVGLRIRVYGDPVLRRVAAEVTDIDGALADLCRQMFTSMYEAPGIGLAAPQVGVSQRFFVYDFGEGPGVLINPEIIGSDGEWTYNEGCLSVPELSWEIVRPRRIHLRAYDLDGNEVAIEAEDLQARLFQHELDHLEGRILLDYLDEDQRREAKRILRQRAMGDPSRPPGSGGSRSGVGRVEVPDRSRPPGSSGSQLLP